MNIYINGCASVPPVHCLSLLALACISGLRTELASLQKCDMTPLAPVSSSTPPIGGAKLHRSIPQKVVVNLLDLDLQQGLQ